MMQAMKHPRETELILFIRLNTRAILKKAISYGFLRQRNSDDDQIRPVNVVKVNRKTYKTTKYVASCKLVYCFEIRLNFKIADINGIKQRVLKVSRANMGIVLTK